MKIGIMKKGDKVLTITAEFIAVQRKNGEVDIIPMVKDEMGLRLKVLLLSDMAKTSWRYPPAMLWSLHFKGEQTMAGKKDKSVVAVISGLTDSQAARISADIMKSKQRNAPNGRGTVASGFTSSVGSLLQKGTKRIGG